MRGPSRRVPVLTAVTAVVVPVLAVVTNYATVGDPGWWILRPPWVWVLVGVLIAAVAVLEIVAARSVAERGIHTPAPVVLGEPVSQVVADPTAAVTRFGVHPAIDAGPPLNTPADAPTDALADAALEVLPLYVPRALDEQLAQVVQDAVDTDTARMVVLVGGSSTGKTRACWETVRALGQSDPDLPWRVWHPDTPERLAAGLAAASGHQPTGQPTGMAGEVVLAPRTVIWLNELQDFLAGPSGEATAAELLDLLDRRDGGPVVVLGTMWPAYWEPLRGDYTGRPPDPRWQARRLIQRRVVDLRPPDRIDDDRAAAERAAGADPRWRLALREAPDQPVQFLAGAAELERRYRDAIPIRRAVLQAAGDARRANALRQLSQAFLIAAATDYLIDHERAALAAGHKDPQVWVVEALNHGEDALTVGTRGVLAPLTELSPPPQDADVPVYELADWLEQHIRRERAATQPHDSLWTAVTTYVTDPKTLTTIARDAEDKGWLRRAATLYQAAAAGDPYAWCWLALVREMEGDRAGAEDACRQAVTVGNPFAWRWLARQREAAGDQAGAEDACRQAAAAGDHPATPRWGTRDLAAAVMAATAPHRVEDSPPLTAEDHTRRARSSTSVPLDGVE